MTPGSVLNTDELRFIALVVARRFGQESAETVDVEVSQPAPGDAFPRAAAAALVLLHSGIAPAVARPAALVAMSCQLEADGYTLLAPQGAAAGMISGLADGRIEEGSLVRWLEDRAVPAGSTPS